MNGMNPVGMLIPTGNPDQGVNLNVLGDLTIVTHRDFSQCAGVNPMLAIQQQQMMLAMVRQQQQTAALIAGVAQTAKLAVASAVYNAQNQIENGRKDPIRIDDGNLRKVNGVLPKGLEARLEAVDADYVKENERNDVNGGIIFGKKENEDFTIDTKNKAEDVVVEYSINDIPEFKIKKNSIFNYANEISNSEKEKELLAQMSDTNRVPMLFSKRDNESAIVCFISLKDGDTDWRNKLKKAILKANEVIYPNFFKEVQEYIVFLHNSKRLDKADVCLFIQPVTISTFLKLEDTSITVKGYDFKYMQDLLADKASSFYRILEPIVPSNSGIKELYSSSDFKYNGVDINPLYSAKISKIRVSVELSGLSVQNLAI